jgi:hypothetical protein
MTDERSWEGNWPARLYERVREHGYSSLTAFAEARPTLPLVELAEELGDDLASAHRSCSTPCSVRGAKRLRCPRASPRAGPWCLGGWWAASS